MPVGQVREAHGRVGLVDVLAAGAARAIGVDAQVLVVDLDLDVVVDLRDRRSTEANDVWRRALASNGEMRTRRCTPASAFSVAVGVRPFDGDRRALDAGALARLLLDQLGLEAAPLAPAQVHAQQHLGPVLRLGAAGAGVDRDDGVAGVVLAAEQLLQLERVHALRRPRPPSRAAPPARPGRPPAPARGRPAPRRRPRAAGATCRSVACTRAFSRVTACARSESFQRSGRRRPARSAPRCVARGQAGQRCLPSSIDARVEHAHPLAQFGDQHRDVGDLALLHDGARYPTTASGARGTRRTGFDLLGALG